MTQTPPPGWRAMDLFDPYERYCGPFFERDADGRRECGFRVEPRHLNAGGVAHGGMLLTFADAVLGSAAWEACGRAPCVTLSMQSQFVAVARGGDWVTCRAEVTKQTRALVFVRGDFFAEGALALSVASIWKILRAGPA